MNISEKPQLEDGTKKTYAKNFRCLVIGLIYLTCTRPDIAFSVGVISRFMQNPIKHHFGAIKRILHYIARIMDYGIWYMLVPELKLCGFIDSDWQVRWMKEKVS